MNKKFKISSVKELDEVAKAIAKMIPSNKIFTLNGELGSGKTTLIDIEEEVENLGFIDYLKDEPLCFIEWPEKFLNFLPKKYVNISIIVEEQYRIITISI